MGQQQVPHRFLVLHVVDSTQNRDLCTRLDRRKDTVISSSRPSLASDGIERILGRKATKEAELKLGTPIPLVRVGVILRAVIDVCPEYRLFQLISFLQELDASFSVEVSGGNVTAAGA